MTDVAESSIVEQEVGQELPVQQVEQVEQEETNESNEQPHEPEESKEDELEIPEPDISEEEVKKKKEMPAWMKKKLERERHKEEAIKAEAERLREENARLKSGYAQPIQQQTNNYPDPYIPQREQFAHESDYFMALADHREAIKSQQYQAQEHQRIMKQHEEEFKKNLSEAIDSGKSKYKDFEDRTDYILYGEGFPSNRAMAEAIVESSYKDDILYFLGTHVKEAERIANLNPISAAKEIAKIEVRLEAKKKSNITKAPKVISTPSGGKGSASHGDPNKMGIEEFTNWYQDKFGR